jgi:hypothetical protein
VRRPFLVAGLLAGAAVLLLAFGARVATGSGSDGSDGDGAERSAKPTVVVEGEEPAGPTRRAVDLVVDTADADPRSFAPPPVALDRLADGDTRFLAVLTPEPVLVSQCSLDADGSPLACRPGVPAVPTLETEIAPVLVDTLVRFEVGRVRVDCATVRCGLVVTGDEGSTGAGRSLALVDLVFGGPARRPVVEVGTVGRVAPGDRVAVRLRGFVPGGRAVVSWCRAPGPLTVGDPATADRCGDPADAVPLRIGADGQASTTLVVPERAGTDGRCTSRRPCAVTAFSTGLPAAIVPVVFAGEPGPDLPTSRVVIGVGIAALLLAVAALLIHRSTRDRPPDPFAGVQLEVPEWDAVEIGEPDWDEQLTS